MAIRGTERKNSTTFLMKTMLFMPLTIYAGIVLGQYLPISKLLESEFSVSSLFFNPLHPPITEYTKPAIGLIFIAYMLLALKMYDPHNYRSNDAYGTAKWASPKRSRKYLAPDNEAYKKALKTVQPNIELPFITARRRKKYFKESKKLPAVESTNRILSKGVAFDLDTKTSKLPNANTIVVGAPGTRKTTSIVYSNCMQLGGSKVICDPKGETTFRLAGLYENAGYKVKILDLIDIEKSDCFNPFEYVESDDDIPRMVSFCFKGMDTSKDGASKDPFWDDANMLEICAVCYLLWYDARKEDQTLPMAMKLVQLNSVEIPGPPGPDGKPTKKTGLTALFEKYAERNGEDNMPMTYFRMFNKAKDKTLANMETTLVAKLQMLVQPRVARLLSHDDMKLYEIGREPQILFLRVPGSDETYNFIVSMLYMFLYKCLDYVADIEEKGNGCRVPVTILQDEFTSFPQPQNYLTILSQCRSRNYSMVIAFQEISRLKQMKCLGESWGAIFGDVGSWVFLGSPDKDTTEYFTTILGKETVTVINKSGSQSSTSQTASDLAPANDLAMMPPNKCIVKLIGEPPMYDDKYPFLLHPNIKLTAIPREGDGIPLYERSIEENKDTAPLIKAPELTVEVLDDVPQESFDAEAAIKQGEEARKHPPKTAEEIKIEMMHMKNMERLYRKERIKRVFKSRM